ncbi:ATP-binding protein [Vibrio hepatarius]|uniref:ATP-binding protein n=1 Tax=Vibrio hepatarius TaxID=171383 RepID=UPI001C088155|nr:ATP-binding protein [Vibrio hepatarius]MBU2896779.1 AAA family ATPase [Vibrio hepatarius]
MNKLVFISGVHGVGKSTLCSQINSFVDIRSYSCSDIIKANSAYVETSKVVDKAEANQRALLEGISKLDDENILLDGHFCLVGKNETIIELDYQVFQDIKPDVVINVFSDAQEIHRRLVSRDGDCISLELIDKLQKQESHNAHEFCSKNGVRIVDYKSGDDVSTLLRALDL